MARLLTLIAIVTLIALAPAVPAHAQPPGPSPTPTPRPVTCVTLLTRSGGWQQYTINVPSWATGLKLEVQWAGLQLRWWIDGVVWGIGWNGETEIWTYGGVDSPPAGGWGGTHTMELGGILVDSIGEWTIYACGAPPAPTPTPTPLPTATPAQGPGCLSRVGEPEVAVDDTISFPGPASGWYIIRVRAVNPLTRWRLDRSGWITGSEERVGSSTFELRAGESVTITVVLGGGGLPTVVIGTPTPTPYADVLGTHTPAHRLYVTVDAVCQGVEITPITPGAGDIKPVEFGVVDEGTDCPISLPRVRFTFSPPPGLPSIAFDFPGVRICFLYRRLSLAWGEFNALDWAIPLLSLGIVWAAWLSLRRG